MLALLLALLLTLAIAPAGAQPLPDDTSLTIEVVESDGRPFAGLPMVAAFDMDGAAVRLGTPLAQGPGMVVLGDIKPGQYRMTLRIAGRPDMPQREVTVHEGVNYLQWPMPPTSTVLAIKVSTEDGGPPPEGLTLGVTTTAGARIPVSLRAAGSGLMEVVTPLPVGDYWVRLSRANVGVLDRKKITIGEGANTLEWKLPPTVAVRMTFKDADGAPISPEAVNVNLVHMDGSGALGGGIQLGKADGAVVLGNFSAGRYRAMVSLNATEADMRSIDLTPETKTYEWRLPRPASLLVLLEPPPAADEAWRFELRTEDGRAASRATLGPAFRDGYLVSPLIPGKYTATLLTAAGAAVVTESLALAPGEAARLTLAPPRLTTLRLRVLLEDGSPVPFRPGISMVRSRDGVPVAVTSVPGVSGEATVADCPPGTYRLQVTLSGAQPYTKAVQVNEGDTLVEYRLPPMPTVTGPILLAEGGMAFPESAVCYALRGMLAVRSGVPVEIADGRYRVRNLLPGPVSLLLITDGGYAVARFEIATDAREVEVPMALRRGGALTVRIRDQAGNATTAVRRVYATRTLETGYVRLPLEIGAGGEVTLPSLPPGEWRLSAVAAVGGMVTATATVLTGETTVVTLTIPGVA